MFVCRSLFVLYKIYFVLYRITKTENIYADGWKDRLFNFPANYFPNKEENYCFYGLKAIMLYIHYQVERSLLGESCFNVFNHEIVWFSFKNFSYSKTLLAFLKQTKNGIFLFRPRVWRIRLYSIMCE